MKRIVALLVLVLATTASAQTTQSQPRQEWGAPLVNVRHDGDHWTIAGKNHTVTLNASDLSMQVQTAAARWRMMPSATNDLLVKSYGDEFPLRLADAKKIEIVRYDTGFKTGVKITLSEIPRAGDLRLFLTAALEGKEEELVCDVAAVEHDAQIRRLDWPTVLDPADSDFTLLPNHRGVMLPRDWPKPYYPIRSTNPDGTAKESDTSEIQSNVIESWSMSWWGFQHGDSAMMVIVETPDDAAYQFDHPAGGPTTLGPRWRASLGSLRYPRSLRFCFFDHGNYVDMAKRYRRYAMDSGLFVSLREKIARTPVVEKLIGTPSVRLGILTNIKSDSLRYSTTNPSHNHHMTPFDERAKQLREYKEKGIDRLHICLTGWPCEGYDRQHPDELPPAPSAGGWDGLKRLADTCRELGYLFSLHDQYRDYYTDAASFDPQFAVHEEDERTPSPAFPGSRFGEWKKGVIPFMNNWDGGTMAYMNNRLMPGHLIKNYTALFDHGIHPDGIYLDVFGYVPPDEDFNPEHPTTRTEARLARIACYNWSRQHLGFVGTEAGCDWAIAYVDWISALRSNKGIPVPLFNLVYRDAVMTQYQPGDLRGFLNGGVPNGFSGGEIASAQDQSNIRRMCALHKRLALCEMTKHEFLDDQFKRERTTFSDGTRVTVDWNDNSAVIAPDLAE